MIAFKKSHSLLNHIISLKKAGKKIGFVPTMGALHPGHLSLLDASKNENDITVCSIFVNPTQFNNPDDFKHYPVTIEKDIEQLIGINCDILFQPSEDEIYPPEYVTKRYDLGELENLLEGFYRPGHFQGVCQVIERLLDITQPDRIYLGAKDYQQCKVIERLISLLGKKNQTTIRIAPTLREKDGLAMSSRNLRLTVEQRQLAPAIHQTMSFIKENQLSLSIPSLVEKASEMSTKKGFQLDYLQIADADTLTPITDTTRKRIVLVAAFLGKIRLIDNLLLN